MTAHMMTADEPMTSTVKASKVDTTADNAGMMAGADMYRRMQSKPKGSSSNGLLMGGVAALAILAGGAYFLTHQTHAGANQRSLMAANTAITADQQAQASKSVAQANQQSKQATADAAQANAVADTGNPPAAATDNTPVRTPAKAVVRHERAAPVVRHVVARQPARSAADAAASGVDTSAFTAPPARMASAATPPISKPLDEEPFGLDCMRRYMSAPAPHPTTPPQQ